MDESPSMSPPLPPFNNSMNIGGPIPLPLRLKQNRQSVSSVGQSYGETNSNNIIEISSGEENHDDREHFNSSARKRQNNTTEIGTKSKKMALPMSNMNDLNNTYLEASTSSGVSSASSGVSSTSISYNSVHGNIKNEPKIEENMVSTTANVDNVVLKLEDISDRTHQGHTVSMESVLDNEILSEQNDGPCSCTKCFPYLDGTKSKTKNKIVCKKEIKTENIKNESSNSRSNTVPVVHIQKHEEIKLEIPNITAPIR